MTRGELRAAIAAAIKDVTSIGGAPNKPCVIGHFSAADAALTALEAAGVRLVPVEELEDLLAGPAAWLDSWAQHVGNCKGGYVCTCGLTLARTEARAALKETGQ